MRAFTHMLAFCKSEKVEILLLAGDLFEAARADERTRRQVFSALAENPSLCVLIAAGNHDPIGPGGNYDGPLPENVYVFPREWSCAEIPAYGARVWGASFASDREPPFAPAARKRRLTPGLYDLGVLHGDLTSADSAYRPLRPERIAETNVQYLALGHIHARSEVRRAGRTLYAYSGCLQGLGFDEVGEKGAYLGEVGEDGLSLSFVKLCGSMTLERTLNVTGCRSSRRSPCSTTARSVPCAGTGCCSRSRARPAGSPWMRRRSRGCSRTAPQRSASRTRRGRSWTSPPPRGGHAPRRVCAADAAPHRPGAGGRRGRAHGAPRAGARAFRL